MKRKINLIITILCMAIAALLWTKPGGKENWPWILIPVFFGLLHLFLPVRVTKKTETGVPSTVSEETPTELVLLNENDCRIASWNIYGKNGIVIGRDTGENHVTVNLDHTVYASMIDIEHAVLNFSGNDWYLEDISSQNGVNVQKKDGKKYRIAYGKPCKLEMGDRIHIGLTRLQLL